MSAYFPPTENIPTFNNSLFSQNDNTGLTLENANTLFLSKINNDTSIASNTSFNGTINNTIISSNSTSSSIGTTIVNQIRTSNLGVGNVIGNDDAILGNGATAGGSFSIAIGRASNTIYQVGATAVGANSSVAHDYSTALGYGATTTGANQIVLGRATEKVIVNGATALIGDVDIGIAGTSGYFNSRFRMLIYDISLPKSNYTQLYMINGGGGSEFVIGPNAIGDKFSIYVKDSGNNQIRQFYVADNATNITGLLTCANGLTLTNGDITAKSNLVLKDISSSTKYMRIYQSGNDFLFQSFNAVSSTISFQPQNSAGTIAEVLKISIPVSTGLLTITGNVLHNLSSYSFPFATQNYQGYYLKQTGSAFTTLTTATYKTIFTAPTQLVAGVWSINWSVKNTITTAGTITSSQSFISTTSVDTNTPVDFTGSLIRSNTSEVYAISDIQVITSSMTLTLTASTTLYLTILKTFSTGAYSFIGEISATRLA